MISPGRGLRLGVVEEEGREGAWKDEKEEKEESNSLMFLFLFGVAEREGLGRAGEGLVADPRTEENEDSRIEELLSLFCFGVIVEDTVVLGRRIPDGAGITGLLVFAGVVIFLLGSWREVLSKSTFGLGLEVGT